MEILLQANLLCALIGALIFQRIPAIQIALSVLLGALYVFLYVYVPDTVAQDRLAYYNWYKATSNVFVALEKDFLFTALLMSFPDQLRPDTFYLLFMSVLMGLLLLYMMLQQRLAGTWHLLGLMILVVLMDRVFIDLVFNTSRSSMAGLVFCFVFLTERWWLRLLVFAMAANVHFGLFAIMLPLYVLSLVLHDRRVYALALLTGVILFALKSIGITLFSVGSLEALLAASSESRLERGFALTNSSISTSQMIQFTLAVTGPALLVLRNILVGKLQPQDSHHLRFMVLSVAAFALAYPEIYLAARLLIVIFLILPLALTARQLQAVASVKSLILLFLLPGLV